MDHDLTTKTPAEVDALWTTALDPIRYHEGLAASTAAWLKRDRERLVQADPTSYRAKELAESIDIGEDLLAQLHQQLKIALDVLQRPFRAEWDRRGGWTRYYLVSGGHLHFYNCPTLTPGKTLVGLLPEASGLDGSEVVGKFDVTACTHCFPDAPVARDRTPEEDGFCKHSGQFISDEQRAKLDARYPSGWHNFAVARSVRCECGGYPSLTKTDKIRKHKPGSPQL